MLWIGLTGSMGSGKSTVANLLRKIGYSVLDADKTVHLILSPGGKAEAEIFRTFGQSVAGADGHLDRRALGRAVFGDKVKVLQLEAILHPLVRQLVATDRRSLEEEGAPVAFYDVPLLFEKKMEKDFDHVVVVSSPEWLRKERLAARSQMTETEFLERSKNQLSPEDKAARASYVIENAGHIGDLEEEVLAMLSNLGLPPPA